MGENLFLDIILFAMVAGFIFLRLRSVLGRRTGHERPRADQVSAGSGDENVVKLPKREHDGEGKPKEADADLWADDSPVGSGLTQIKIADHAFEPGDFVQGAKAAYEMIVQAFAEGDRETLRRLLTDEVFENFAAAIEEREEQGHSQDTSIVAINTADIVDAELKGRMAEVTVKFVSEMISVRRDEEGQMLPDQTAGARDVTDIWTFGRDTGSRDPNWQLIETRSEN